MKLRTTMQCTAAIAMLGLGAINAGASVIDHSFASTVDFSTFTTVQPGAALTFSYSVDTGIAPLGSTTFAIFHNVSNMSITAGAFSATSAQGVLLQVNAPSLDQYVVNSEGTPASSSLEGLDLVYLQLEAFDPTGTAISNARTVVGDPSLSAFTVFAFWAVFASASGDVGGVIHGIMTRSAVPEPATLALFALALAGLALSRRTQGSMPRRPRRLEGRMLAGQAGGRAALDRALYDRSQQ